MGDIKPISPFTFISWKEDENSIVVGAKDTSFGYVALMQIDDINIDEIVDYAKSQRDERNWQNDFAKNFPFYVSAVASQKGVPCFVETKHAAIEYCDLQTNEVLEAKLEATEDAYNEAVRIEVARAEYDKLRNLENQALPSVNPSSSAKKAAAQPDDGGSNEEDLYEDTDDDENDTDHSKSRLFEMIFTQIQTALSLGVELGLTYEEIKGAYGAALGPSQVPQTLEECTKIAENNPYLMNYLLND